MASYPLPPWLSPSAAQGYGSLAGEGQRLNLERQKLQQEAVQASMEMQARQQEIAQRSAAQAQETARQYQLETQRAAIDKAYKESEIGLRQQQFDFDTQQASKQFAAQQRYSTRFQKNMLPKEQGGGGMGRQDAALDASQELIPFMTPDAAAKLGTFKPPVTLGAKVPIPDRPDITAIQTGPNQIRVIPPAADTNAPTEVNFQGGKWERNPSSGKYEMVRDRPKTAAEVDEELMQQAQARRGGGAGGALPLPNKKSELKKGQTYKTARGDAEWDGEKFVLKAK